MQMIAAILWFNNKIAF